MLRLSIMTFAAIGVFAVTAPAHADYEDPLAGLFYGLQNDAPARQIARGPAIAGRETPKPEAQGSGANRHWGKHHHHGVILEGSF